MPVPDPFTIVVTEGAESDLSALSTYAQRVILDGIDVHLSRLPTQTTRRIKSLRINSVAEWELRLGDYRILYNVDEQQRTVSVQVIGEKVGNRLIVQGQEYTEHESDRPE
jgi:mRNA-degrading endonuclease RelE of RelBE toxin-antitoxin system